MTSIQPRTLYQFDYVRVAREAGKPQRTAIFPKGTRGERTSAEAATP